MLYYILEKTLLKDEQVFNLKNFVNQKNFTKSNAKLYIWLNNNSLKSACRCLIIIKLKAIYLLYKIILVFIFLYQLLNI